MTSSVPIHPRLPSRAGAGALDLVIVQRARELIDELGTELDARLADEDREAERLELLRATTNRITRAANDAIVAYRRGQRSVTLAMERPGGDDTAALEMRAKLQAARLELLRALDDAARRYPWAAEPPSG